MRRLLLLLVCIFVLAPPAASPAQEQNGDPAVDRCAAIDATVRAGLPVADAAGCNVPEHMTSNSIVRRGLERIGAATVVIGLFILLLRIGQHFVARATPNRTNEYRLPPYYAAVGLICGAFAGLILGMGMLGGMSPARGDFAAWLGLVLFFGGGAVYLVVCAGNWRLWLDENGIQKRDYWGRTGRFTPWTEILRVRKGRYHFHFDVRLGERISLPFQVPGLLEAMLGAYFNGADFDHKARETLEAVWSELGFEEPLWWVGA